jgi:hypothetical protein
MFKKSDLSGCEFLRCNFAFYAIWNNEYSFTGRYRAVADELELLILVFNITLFVGFDVDAHEPYKDGIIRLLNMPVCCLTLDCFLEASFPHCLAHNAAIVLSEVIRRHKAISSSTHRKLGNEKLAPPIPR